MPSRAVLEMKLDLAGSPWRLPETLSRGYQLMKSVDHHDHGDRIPHMVQAHASLLKPRPAGPSPLGLTPRSTSRQNVLQLAGLQQLVVDVNVVKEPWAGGSGATVRTAGLLLLQEVHSECCSKALVRAICVFHQAPPQVRRD